MMTLILRIVIPAIIIFAVSELSRRSPRLGADSHAALVAFGLAAGKDERNNELQPVLSMNSPR